MSKEELIRQWEESIEEPTIEFEASIVGLANHIFDGICMNKTLTVVAISSLLIKHIK